MQDEPSPQGASDRRPGLRATRSGAPIERAGVNLRDVALVAIHLALLPLAAFVPEHRWHAWARRATAPFGRLETPAIRQRREGMQRLLAGYPELEVADIDRAALAHRLEEILCYLKAGLPGGWNPQLRLTGGHHLDRALEAGRGAVLWVAPQVAAALCVKKALFEAGYAVHHMSSPNHGISRTRFGARFLNPIQLRAESRLLAERILKEPGIELRATRAAAQRLAENRLVSISCIPIGQRLIQRKMLSGRMYFAPGAASLSLAAGAPLLPVFCRAGEEGSMEATVEAPLEPPHGLRGRDAVEALVSSYAQLVEAETLRDPASSLIWHHV